MPQGAGAGTQPFRLCEQQALTDVGQAEVEAAPHRHTDAEGPQSAVPQRLPAHHRRVRLVLGRGHLQLVVGPDGRPALAQQGLGTRQGRARGKELPGSPVWGAKGSGKGCLRMP